MNAFFQVYLVCWNFGLTSASSFLTLTIMTETNARSTINFFSVIGVFMYLACSVGQLGGIQVRQIVTAYPWLSISILLIFTQTLADQGYKEMSIYVGLVPVHQIISFIRYSLANSALLCFEEKVILWVWCLKHQNKCSCTIFKDENALDFKKTNKYTYVYIECQKPFQDYICWLYQSYKTPKIPKNIYLVAKNVDFSLPKTK